MSQENVDLFLKGYEAFARRDLVFLRYRGRGKESGAALEALMAHVWTMGGGQAVRLRQFLDRCEALEAVGLSEQDAHLDA